MVATVKYEIAKKLSKVEIRRHPSIVITRVEGYEDEGFGLLFASFQAKTSRKQK